MSSCGADWATSMASSWMKSPTDKDRLLLKHWYCCPITRSWMSNSEFSMKKGFLFKKSITLIGDKSPPAARDSNEVACA